MQSILHDRKYRKPWQVWHVHSIHKKSCSKMISTVGCVHDLLVQVRDPGFGILAARRHASHLGHLEDSGFRVLGQGFIGSRVRDLGLKV